jgi:hypothetical protein
MYDEGSTMMDRGAGLGGLAKNAWSVIALLLHNNLLLLASRR